MKSETGFTLIETVVYLGLFALLIGGTIVAAYSVFESSDRLRTIAMLQQEGYFIIAKIEWALGGANTVTLPAVGASGPTLSFARHDGLVIVLETAGADMTLQRNVNSPQILNNADVQISGLNFVHEWAGGINPERIEAHFTLSANTANGARILQNFSTVKYIRR